MAGVNADFDLMMAELTSLGFMMSACTEMMTKPGSHEREIMAAASRDFKYRTQLLHGKLRVQFQTLMAAAVAAKLSEPEKMISGAAIAAGNAASAYVQASQWTAQQIEEMKKELSKPYDQMQVDKMFPNVLKVTKP